jgi:hypothetical protein
MHDLTNTYPDDIYSPKGTIFYGDRSPFDAESILIIQSAKEKPNKLVKVYRAVPKVINSADRIKDIESQKTYILKYGKLPKYVNTHLDKSEYYDSISQELDKLKITPIQEDKITINKGDWVTISKGYAVQHGRSWLQNRYKILSKTTQAKNLYTDGNSIHEWGYDP